MVFYNCPADVEELAEAYCMGLLEREMAEIFEDHYLACPECARVTFEALAFVDAFRQVEGVLLNENRDES
jgi:4-hydroxy-3-methylbut-2-en-1-yl diphosphate synthase IspG/GcpE